MANAIKDYVKFNVLGLEVDVSAEDNKRLNELKALSTHYKNYAEIPFRDYYVVEMDYNLTTQAKIFDYKIRTGKNLTFKNSHNKLCFIDEAKAKGSTVSLKCRFYYNKNKYFYVSLPRFLELYANREFHDVCPKRFAEIYLKTADECLAEINAETAQIKAKYNNLYKSTEKQLYAQYNAEINKYEKLEKEAKSRTKELNNDEAIKVAKNYCSTVKDYWNSKLTKEERLKLLSWISQNIYSIRVYGLLKGQSGQILNQEYNNVAGIKYRNPSYNEQGQLTSQDSISAHISFKNVETAPVELLKKVCSNSKKRKSPNLFYHNRLIDKNFTLYMLSEYNQYGFEAGKIKLNKFINYEKLLQNESQTALN